MTSAPRGHRPGLNDPFLGWLPVADGGYRWDAPAHDPCRALTLIHSDDRVRPDGYRTYEPLAVPDLHRKFGRVRPTPGGILAFADRYGELGHSTFSVQGDEFRDTFDQWQRTIAEVRGLLTLWSLVQQRNATELNRFIRRVQQRNNPPFYVTALVFIEEGLDIRASEALTERAVRTEQERSIFTPWPPAAHNMLAAQIGPPVLSAIAGQSSAWDLARWAGATVDTAECQHDGGPCRLSLHERDGNPSATPASTFDTVPPLPSVTEAGRSLIRALLTGALSGHASVAVRGDAPGGFAVVPDCLSAAIYVSFALDVAGRTKRNIRCEHCHQLFVPHDARQKHCDGGCRRAAYRERQRAEQQGTT